MELQLQVPKPRNRKISVFGRMSREDDISETEYNVDLSMAPSSSSVERSRQPSGNLIIALTKYLSRF